MRIVFVVAMGLMVAGCDKYGDAKEAVRRTLRDPQSAKFRDVQECPHDGVVWGEVNGKNVYGAYVGFQPFVYAGGQAAIAGTDGAYTPLSDLCNSKVPAK